MPVRILDPQLRRQDLPRLLRDAVRRGRRAERRRAGDHRRRPDRLGQGHAGQPSWRARSATTTLDSGALYRATALAALRARRPADDAPALAALAATLAAALRRRPRAARRRRRHRRAAPRSVGALASRISALPAVRQALHELQLSFRRAARAWWPTGATWAPWCSPTRRSRCSSPRAPRTRAERRHKQLISKGISANIDDSSRRPGSARRARQNRARRAPEAGRRCAAARQLGAHDRSNRSSRCCGWWQQRSAFEREPTAARRKARRPAAFPPVPSSAPRRGARPTQPRVHAPQSPASFQPAPGNPHVPNPNRHRQRRRIVCRPVRRIAASAAKCAPAR